MGCVLTRAAATDRLPPLLRRPRLQRDCDRPRRRGRHRLRNAECGTSPPPQHHRGGSAMIDVEPLIRTELESLTPLPDAARQDWENVLARSGQRNRRSRRRLLLAVAAGIVSVAASGAGIAAALGAFSGGVTIAQVRACDPSTVALTTPSGAEVLTGHTEEGIYCLAYRSANGGGGGSGGRLGGSPA